jgi:hypothetical protein
MSQYPLQAWAYGRGLGADDVEFGYDETGAVVPFRPFRRMRQAFGRRCPPGGDDDLGDDDVGDLEGDDEEIDGLGADDEDVGLGADPDDNATAARMEIGAIGNRIQKLRAKLIEKRAELAATPGHKIRRRRKLQNQIAKIQRLLAKKQSKAQAKMARAQRRYGAPIAGAAGLAAGAGLAYGGLDGGLFAGEEQLSATDAALAGMGQYGIGLISQPPRKETRIPFETGGLPLANFTIAQGANLRTVALAFQTAVITYAAFRVKSVQVEVKVAPGNNAQGFYPGDILLNLLVTDVTVSGDINLLYRTEPVEMVAQGAWLGGTKTITGLRKNPVMDKNETAVCNMTMRQEITNAAAINGTVEAALICDTISDRHATGN